PGTPVPCGTNYVANQEKQLGLAHAVLHGEAFAGDDAFVVALADTIIDGGDSSLLARMIAAHQQHGAAATIATERVPPDRISRYGVLEPERATGAVFCVRSIAEKPRPDAAPGDQSISGRYA